MATRKTAVKTTAAKKTVAVKAPKKNAGVIRVGIGGWTFEPWRGLFYPKDLVQKRELEYASRKLNSIEINGTFYGSQKPATFAKWRDETPDGFVFSLKAPRFSTHRRVLSEAGESVERFLSSGVLELQDKLGPINWQFAPTKQFDADDFEGFLKLLPAKVEGHAIRHAVEVRHESFRDEAFIALARKYGVAIVMSGDSHYPQIADVTAPFVYARIMGTTEDQAQGYDKAALDLWAKRAREWSSGATPKGLETAAKTAPEDTARDVYLYVISGFKAHNPAAAMALTERLNEG
ncbi:DUF72 domain-containing protein [Caballeronia sp. DA-9]|uniref:DUF72 domain-containing protein n=1 Tax=Caballeronia sp. DA-9 TaxID=3436237 RepID=UPI003F672080